MNSINNHPLDAETETKLIKVIIQKQFGSLSLLSVKRLSGGIYNSSYLLSMANHQKYVLRISPKLNRMFSYDKHLMSAEARATKLCSLQGIPVPQIVVVDESLEIVDRPYMLSLYIPARSLHQIKIPEPEKANCYADAGRAIRMMHSITGSCFGRLAHQIDQNGFATWGEAILYELQESKRIAESVNLFPQAIISKIEELFISYVDVLNQINIPYLAHGDLWSGNILASYDNGKCHFKAVIDMDHAIWGDPEFDFSGGMMNNAFANGYGMQLEGYHEKPNSFIRRKLYLLLYCMKQCYKYCHLYNDKYNSEKQRTYINQILDEFR